MTVICGGGTSSLKPGTGGQVIFSAALITAGLELIQPWLLPVAAGIDSFVYEALTQCASDPPAMPTTAALNPINAIGGILNPNFGTWLSAVHDLLLNWAWQTYCQCDAAPAPTFSYPPPPANVTIPGGSTQAPCYGSTWSGTPWDDTANPPLTNHIPQLAPPGTLANGAPWQAATNVTNLNTPVPLSVSVTVTVTWTTAVAHLAGCFFTFLTSAHAFISAANITVSHAGAGTVTRTQTVTIPSNTAAMYVSVFEQPGGNYDPAATSTVSVAYSCSSSGVGSPTTPCAPDPLTLELLVQIHQLAEAIYLAVPPQLNSYAESTVHPGLVGNGHITLLDDPLAIRVDITSDTTGKRIDIGDPDYLFDRGYIVPIAVEGPIRRQTRLVYNPQLYTLPDLTEQIGYSLPTGITISITELVRGP